jgi:transposase
MQAIVFVLRTGCQWNALNATGICSSSSAHHRFQEWGQAGVFYQMWVKGLFDYEELCGIQWDWQAMDGAMTKAPLGGGKTGPNPTDRAKRGVKRNLLTDGAGVPLGVAVDGANRNDFKMARATLESVPIPRPEPTPAAPQGLCLDAGFDYPEVYALAAEFGYTAHVRPRGEEAQAIKREAGYKARRRVVERTHSWLNRFRRILIRWEKKPENYLAMLHLACALVTYRAAGLPG